jgi:hypothetical protein
MLHARSADHKRRGALHLAFAAPFRQGTRSMFGVRLIVVACALSACEPMPPPAAPAATATLACAEKTAAPAPSSPAKSEADAGEALHTAPDDPFLHRLQKFFDTEPRPSTEPACPFPPARTEVSEISIERTVCFGSCPIYSLTLHADGSVDYYGEAFVDHLGKRHGRIEPAYFDQLARLAEDIGWFGFANSYSCSVTDNPVVYTSLVRKGVRKTIFHYAPRMTGPPRLGLFEDTIDDYTRRFTVWSDSVFY